MEHVPTVREHVLAGGDRRGRVRLVMPASCRPCGKLIFNRQRALGAALSSSRTFGKPFRVYRCPHGNGYHLTSKL